MLTVFVGHPLLLARMVKFYEKMMVPPPTAKLLKLEAKLAKKFTVLIKRKLQRDQLCRSKLFRRLMALVFDPSGQENLGKYFGICYNMLQFTMCYDMLQHVTAHFKG